MALKTRELFSSATKSAFPRIIPTNVYPKIIDAAAGGPTLAVGTPMVYVDGTNSWRSWVNADTGAIDGFLYPDEVTQHATNESLGHIMVGGEIHYADVALPAGQTQSILDEALRDLSGTSGWYVTELAGSR